MFPPILTNRTLNSTNSTPLNDDDGLQQHSHSLSPISQSVAVNVHTDSSSLAASTVKEASNAQFKLFYTCPDFPRGQSPVCSECSDYVDDDWSSIEDGDNPRTSREAQEAEIEDKYRSALNFLQEGNIERAVSIFSALLVHPVMSKYHIADWSTFDWQKAKTAGDGTSSQRIVPNMAKLYFNINLAMSGLAKDPFQFYVQALSIRPDFKDLWFNCGQCAIRRRDWRSAAFCMTQCEDEFRALEALLLIHYFNNDYLRCTNVLQRVFDAYPEHRTGHIIRQLISDSSPFWAEHHSKIFSANIVEFNVSKSQRNEVLQTFDAFFQHESHRMVGHDFAVFRTVSPIPKWAPLVVKLKPKTKMEQLAKLLCNIFDRINAYSSFAEQRVAFEYESMGGNCILMPSKVTKRAERQLAIGVRSGQSNSEMDEEQMEGELSSTEMRQSFVSDEPNAMTLLEQIATTETEIPENQNAMERAETDEQQQEQQINESNNEQTTIWDQQGMSMAQENEATAAAMPETQDEISLRRSTRLFDDLDYFGNANKQRQTQANDSRMDALTLMGFDEHELEEHQASVSNHRQSMQFMPDSISSPQQLSSVDELFVKLIDETSFETTKFPDVLYTFLTWVAFEQQPFVVLTLEQVEAYRDVYARWSSLFCLSNCSFTESDLAIHQLAAELGSHRALSILQAFYGRLLLQQKQQKTTAHSPNGKTMSIEGHAEENGNVTEYQFHRQTAMDDDGHAQQKLLFTGDNDALFRWVFHRIQAEQQQMRQTLAGNNINNSRSPTVIGRNQSINKNYDADHLGQSKDCTKLSTIRRQLEVRYKWLIANLLPDELCLPNSEAFHFIHIYTQLTSALALMEPEWALLSHAEFDLSCLTVRNLKELLRKRVRQFQLQQIDYLIDAKRYEELKNVLLHQYDWTSDSEDAHIKQKLLMIQCIRETDNSLLDIGEWISKILNELGGTDLSSFVAKRFLRRCLHLLDELFPANQIDDRNASTEHFFATVGFFLGKLLQQKAPHEKLKQHTDLWRWCYKIAKFREEGEQDVAELKKFYNCCANGNTFLDRRLPTKTTTLLAKGHEVLGKAKKCSRNEGAFLRLLIDEFLSASRDPSIRSVIASDAYKDIRDNIALEIMQCLRCCLSDKFGHSRFRSNRVVDHGSKLQWPVDWAFAAKVLELILPQKLPDICSDRRVPSDLAELLTKAFDPMLTVDPAQLQALDELLHRPFRLELEEKFDSDGLCCGYEERLQISEEGQTRLDQLLTMPMLVDAETGDQQRGEQCQDEHSEFCAKCIYLLAHYHYRTGTGTEGEWLRKCLAIGGAHLPRHILASAWYALGRSLTYEYAIKSDTELLDQVEAYVFPFKMALFLHWEFAESHLDVGTIIYQLRTRFARFKMQKEVSKELRCKAQTKIEGMLLKCKVHFCLALRFNDSPKDVAWLSNYFLAKIGEKLGEQPEKVLDLYYHCALALEEEGIQYLTKINRVKQTYFEPLEIHYKVHAYALRYLKALNAPSFPPRTSAQCATDLANIHAYLTLFRYHGVQRRCLEDSHWSVSEFYDKQSILDKSALDKDNRQIGEQPKSIGGRQLTAEVEGGEIEDVVHSLCCASELQHEIVRMCRTAFDIILLRFPHYKAYFRVARAFFDEKNFVRSTDILFDKLFLTGRKQRCNNFLENIVEIKRTDFERNGSFPYHLCKIVNLAAKASYKCGNIGRLKELVVALTAYKPSSSSREILGDSMIREMMANVLRGFKCLVDKQLKPHYGHDIQHLGKLIEQMEAVIGKLKRDGRCQKERTELETTLIACIQRRDKISQQQSTGNINCDDIQLLSTCTAAAGGGPKPNHFHHQLFTQHHHQQQQQRHHHPHHQHFIAQQQQQLPIGLKCPTTHNLMTQQQHQLQHNQTTMTTTATTQHNSMLQKILPTLDLDRHGLGVMEKFRVIQALFERMGYEFPKEKAAEISRKINEPYNNQPQQQQAGRQQLGQATSRPPTLQQQQNTPSTSGTTTSCIVKNPSSFHPKSTPPAERKRMTGLPPNAKSKCKNRMSNSSASTTWMPTAGGGGSGGTQFGGPIAMPTTTMTVGDGAPPPTKIRRKENDGGATVAATETENIFGTHNQQHAQPSAKNVIITLNDDNIFPINRSHFTNQHFSNAQKTLAFPRQKAPQKQTHITNAAGTSCKNRQTNSDTSPMPPRPPPPSSAGTSSSSLSASVHHDPCAGLPRHHHYPHQPQQPSLAVINPHQLHKQQQQSSSSMMRMTTTVTQPTCSSPSIASSTSFRQQAQLQHHQHGIPHQGQQQQQQQQNVVNPLMLLPSQRNNAEQQQQQPDLLLSHLVNMQTVEQLRLLGERFGLNWSNGGKQRK
ncbi:hypothetical protein niasHT_035841 [Heterodera trifolii]|uniref:Calcineurin-binding protein cabin-1 n=1 Tax=Heterodera trifolii TaxID=157864 RepID=A0ABD2ID20_9BILA